MAASSAKIGYGATVTLAGTAIEELVSVTVPNIALATPDATHMGSDNTHTEVIPGLCEGGEITIEANARPKATGQALVTSNLQARTTVATVVTMPSSLGTWTANCLVTRGWSGTFTAGDTMRHTCTLKVNGKPTIA
jgi:hypothetical protein